MRSSMRKKMKSRTNNKETIFIHRIRRAKSCGFFNECRNRPYSARTVLVPVTILIRSS